MNIKTFVLANISPRHLRLPIKNLKNKSVITFLLFTRALKKLYVYILTNSKWN